jgi:hypothetical protein
MRSGLAVTLKTGTYLHWTRYVGNGHVPVPAERLRQDRRPCDPSCSKWPTDPGARPPVSLATAQQAITRMTTKPSNTTCCNARKANFRLLLRGGHTDYADL